jgi:hypothetical protein
MALRTFSRYNEQDYKPRVPLLWQVYDKLLALPKGGDIGSHIHDIVINDLLKYTSPKDHRATIEKLIQDLPNEFIPVLNEILAKLP